MLQLRDWFTRGVAEGPNHQLCPVVFGTLSDEDGTVIHERAQVVVMGVVRNTHNIVSEDGRTMHLGSAKVHIPSAVREFVCDLPALEPVSAL